MGKIIKFGRQWWSQIFLGVGILTIVGLVWHPDTRWIWQADSTGDWGGDATRNVLFAFGALGGIFGLILASRRLDKFSEQVEIGQKQAGTAEANLFNDRLSRAIVGLSNNESLAARNAALRLLKNLGEDLPEGDRNRDLVCEIIHGFIRDRAMLLLKDINGQIPPLTETPEARADNVLAITVLFDLVEKENRKKYTLSKLDLRLLNLSRVWLQGAVLSETDLRGANLFYAHLQGAILVAAKLQSAFLSRTDLREAILGRAELQDAVLDGAKLRGAHLSEVNFHCAEMTGADFEGVRHLSQEQLDKIVYSIFSPPRNMPEDIDLPRHRAYEIKDGKRYFVESDEPESGRLVDEVLEEERQGREGRG